MDTNNLPVNGNNAIFTEWLNNAPRIKIVNIREDLIRNCKVTGRQIYNWENGTTAIKPIYLQFINKVAIKHTGGPIFQLEEATT